MSRQTFGPRLFNEPQDPQLPDDALSEGCRACAIAVVVVLLGLFLLLLALGGTCAMLGRSIDGPPDKPYRTAAWEARESVDVGGGSSVAFGYDVRSDVQFAALAVTRNGITTFYGVGGMFRTLEADGGRVELLTKRSDSVVLVVTRSERHAVAVLDLRKSLLSTVCADAPVQGQSLVEWRSSRREDPGYIWDDIVRHQERLPLWARTVASLPLPPASTQ